VPDDLGEVDNVPHEQRDVCREISDEEKNKGKNSMKLLTWNACRLLARGRELALVNLLMSTGTTSPPSQSARSRRGPGSSMGRLHHILATSKCRRQNTSYCAREE
jgi:hypothetical protein